MTYDDIYQAIASALLFIAIYETGNHRLRGPALAVAAETIFIGIGYAHSVWSLSVVGVVLGFVQGRVLVKWKREGLAW